MSKEMTEETKELVFEPFMKLSRLKRECVITEKIDGTNAQILFGPTGELLVGSKKRQIWPEGTEGKDKGCDNYGFAGWVYRNREQLWVFLGEGRHFGEWAGLGIQRNYGLDHKRFFLFNTGRFGPGRQEIPENLREIGLDAVPVIATGAFTTSLVDDAMDDLKNQGSKLKGYKDPEGIVVYHTALRSYFKVTYEHDVTGKGPDRQDRG